MGRCLLMQSSRYAHARQMQRGRASTRKLKTQLGRIVREAEYLFQFKFRSRARTKGHCPSLRARIR